MFAPDDNRAVAPVTTPVFTRPGNDDTIEVYVEAFKATDLNTKTTVATLIKLLAETADDGDDNNEPDNAALTANCKKAFVSGAPAAILSLFDGDTQNPPTENCIIKEGVEANEDACINWFVDLVNAAKKKPLESSNVEGYFASLGHAGTKGGPVAHLINSVAPYFPDNIGSQAFRDLLVDNKWTDYRCTRVSAGVILSKFAEDFIHLGIFNRDDAVHTAINNCANNKYDVRTADAIPDKVKGFGMIYLDTAGTPIDSWYQGKAARDEMPPVTVRTAKEIFRRYMDVKADVGNLNEFTEVGDFDIDRIRDFFS